MTGVTEELDRLLALHCAPALLGAKPANLMRLSAFQYLVLQPDIRRYQCLLRRRGIRFRVFFHGGGALLLAYRPGLLLPRLGHPLSRQLLAQAGYPESRDLRLLLGHLQKRLASGRQFPHEIGLFLGYPPQDVQSFAACQGKNCLLCGYWKVYSDVDRARLLFQQYDLCRDYLWAQVVRGAAIPAILPA